jgi:predicted GNAT family N-acyltransferase
MNIKLAKTKLEMERIFQFRYKIYIEELGKNHLANNKNHTYKKLKDDLDEDSFLFYKENKNNQITGTMRIRLIDQSDIEYKQYQINRIDIKGKVATVSRLMVAQNLRAKFTGTQFAFKAYEFGLKNGVQFCYIEIEEKLKYMYEKLGFKCIRTVDVNGAGSRLQYCLELNNVAHLKKIKSPFINLLKH